MTNKEIIEHLFPELDYKESSDYMQRLRKALNLARGDGYSKQFKGYNICVDYDTYGFTLIGGILKVILILIKNPKAKVIITKNNGKSI